MNSRAERQGVREPRDLSKWDTWKKYVIGTHRRFDPIDPRTAGTDGGNRYFFEEATWQKEDGSPKIVAQVHPDFGTLDDDGRYLWSVEWDFPDGAHRDHGKIEGRSAAKARCLAIVTEGSAAAHARRQAERGAIEHANQTGWQQYEPDADDGAEWRQPVKPRRTRRKKEAVVTFDDVPDDA